MDIVQHSKYSFNECFSTLCLVFGFLSDTQVLNGYEKL